MRITFLGTGTSQGVPVIACTCKVCQSNDKKDKRLRTSVLVEIDGLNILIDSGPDFRYQMLRANISKLDAIIFTHGHKDHTAGLDDVRAFNYVQNKEIDLYASTETEEVLRREFQYIFNNSNYPGIPRVHIHHIENIPFKINNTPIIPIEVLHYKLEVLGFRIGDFTYITDANYISNIEKEKIKGSKVLVLNALRYEKHVSHFTLPEAISLAQELQCEHTYFTHISHQLGTHNEVSKTLPLNMSLAYDNLDINL